MSNETKRDVFEDLVEELANAYIALDGEGIGEDLTNEDKQAYLKDYDAALPDDLPVIPFRVAEVIKTNQADTELTIVLMRAKTGHQPDDYWINNHQDTFASAWVLGVWSVEETGEIVKLEAEK
ncbi:hypothetical protein [Lacticaseibacillus paracasei]|uniref:hypothetical protein n=1 Tax=Lacticaseibacillus paracasei TaxID=1597 RepID=UPI00280AA827|nr:hypothetical protein [Lacticaseibacillus paracasei]